MKKTLSLIAAGLVALGASAQVEAIWSNQESLEALGLSGSATSLNEGSVLAEGEAGVFTNYYTDDAKIMSISSDNVKSVIVNGQEFSLTSGTTGSSNPAGIGIESIPTGGWVYNFSCKKDGNVVLFSKLSSNKSYYVFEGETGNPDAFSLMSYTLTMLFQGEVCSYTLPGDDDADYFNMDLPDAEKYSDGTSLRWPEKIFLGADAEDVKKNGFGCVYFPVLAGYDYLFCAQGSKANTNGFIFVEGDIEQILAVVPEKTDDEGNVTPATTYAFLGTSGISSVAADEADVNAPVYNVLGQRVSKNAKGLLIQNGRKFYNR